MKKNIGLLLAFIICLTVYTGQVSADTDDVFPWTWGVDTESLSVQCFTSDFTSQIMDHFDDWNSIDNNIFFDYCTWKGSMDDEGCDIQFYETDLPGTTIATTYIDNKLLGLYWQKDISTYTGSIERCRIYLDDQSDGLASISTDWQNKCIVHEIGHALALDHPDCGSDAIMNQGQASPAQKTIQTHDEDNLKSKW